MLRISFTSRLQLHDRLVASLDSAKFLDQLKSLQEELVNDSGCEFSSREASGFYPFRNIIFFRECLDFKMIDLLVVGSCLIRN